MQLVRDKTGIQPDTRQRYANQAVTLAIELGAIVVADPTAPGEAATVQYLTDPSHEVAHVPGVLPAPPGHRVAVVRSVPVGHQELEVMQAA